MLGGVRADARQILVRLSAERVTEQKLRKMRDLFASAKGTCGVTLVLQLGEGTEAVLNGPLQASHFARLDLDA